MNIRFVTKTVHAFLDYPVALSLVATPFLLGIGRGNPKRRCSSRAREKECQTMSNTNKNLSASVAATFAAGVALFGLISSAAASDQNNPAVLTSHSPWLAPTGHRQPTVADAPQGEEILSAWERQQQVLDAELDRKLVICRGC